MKATTTKWKIIIYECKIELIVLVFLYRSKGVFVSLDSHVACFTPSCCFFHGLARGLSYYMSSLCLRCSFLSCVARCMVDIQCLSCFHFLRLNVAIVILAFYHHVVVFRRIVRMWLYFVKLVGREFRVYELVFEVFVALVWDKWTLGP